MRVQAIQDAHALEVIAGVAAGVVDRDAHLDAGLEQLAELDHAGARRTAHLAGGRRAVAHAALLHDPALLGGGEQRMDELHVGAEQLRVFQQLHRARPGGVHRDRQPERARAAPVDARRLDRDVAAQEIRGIADVARADAEREQAVLISVARHPLALDPREALRDPSAARRACPAACRRRGGRARPCRASREARRRRARASGCCAPSCGPSSRRRSSASASPRRTLR